MANACSARAVLYAPAFPPTVTAAGGVPPPPASPARIVSERTRRVPLGTPERIRRRDTRPHPPRPPRQVRPQGGGQLGSFRGDATALRRVGLSRRRGTRR